MRAYDGRRMMVEPGTTVIVTGSTDGIGREAARMLAERGMRVIVHGRDVDRVEQTVASLAGAVEGRSQGEGMAGSVEGVRADLARQREVRRLAEELKSRSDPPGVVINNAGVFMRERILTEDGFETTFAVNYLAPFLLVNLLADTLTAQASARVVNVSSIAHSGGRLDFDDLNGEHRFEPYDAYARSKLALIMFTYDLAERFEGTGVTANALHPGVIDTKLLRAGFPHAGGDQVERGGERLVQAALSEELEGVSGYYFVDGRARKSESVTYDPEARRRLWELSKEMTGLR